MAATAGPGSDKHVRVGSMKKAERSQAILAFVSGVVWGSIVVSSESDTLSLKNHLQLPTGKDLLERSARTNPSFVCGSEYSPGARAIRSAAKMRLWIRGAVSDVPLPWRAIAGWDVGRCGRIEAVVASCLVRSIELG